MMPSDYVLDNLLRWHCSGSITRRAAGMAISKQWMVIAFKMRASVMACHPVRMKGAKMPFQKAPVWRAPVKREVSIVHHAPNRKQDFHLSQIEDIYSMYTRDNGKPMHHFGSKMVIRLKECNM